jgi:hypothetical protein
MLLATPNDALHSKFDVDSSKTSKLEFKIKQLESMDAYLQNVCSVACSLETEFAKMRGYIWGVIIIQL